MTTGPLAHSKNALGRTHLLRDHSEAVAVRAEGYAALFDSSGFALCAGLWHDLGKNADDFQKRLAEADDTHIEGAPGSQGGSEGRSDFDEQRRDTVFRP